MAAVLYNDGIVRVWHTADGQLQAVIDRGDGEAVGNRTESKAAADRAALCFSPDSSLLAIGSGIGVVDLFHVHSGKPEQHWEFCADIQEPLRDALDQSFYTHVSFAAMAVMPSLCRWPRAMCFHL